MSDLDAAADLAVAKAAIAVALLTEFAADDPEGEIRRRAMDAVIPIVVAEKERQAAELDRLRARIAELEDSADDAWHRGVEAGQESARPL